MHYVDIYKDAFCDSFALSSSFTAHVLVHVHVWERDCQTKLHQSKIYDSIFPYARDPLKSPQKKTRSCVVFPVVQNCSPPTLSWRRQNCMRIIDVTFRRTCGLSGAWKKFQSIESSRSCYAQWLDW